MQLTVNIGLNVNGVQTLTHAGVFRALESHGLAVASSEVSTRGDEPTVIARVVPIPSDRWEKNIFALAQSLQQDCIAVFDELIGRGVLIGPLPWGDFNPRLFQLPNGMPVLVREGS